MIKMESRCQRRALIAALTNEKLDTCKEVDLGNGSNNSILVSGRDGMGELAVQVRVDETGKEEQIR